MAGKISETLQLAQARWLKNWQLFLISAYMNDAKTALEVGCGCGYIMSNIARAVSVRGIDINNSEVQCATRRGLDACYGDGKNIPYDDNSFDIVYGNYLLMWTASPERVLEEMFRVSKKYVVLFAEPYWSGAVYSPTWLGNFVDKVKQHIKKEGGNADIGLQISSMLDKFDGTVWVGTVPMYSQFKELQENVASELAEFNVSPAGEIKMFYVPTFWGILSITHNFSRQ